MRIIHCPEHLLEDVRELYRTCHPKWPALPLAHFQAHPTLIAIESYPIHVAGYSSYSMNVGGDGILAMRLMDTGVHPEARGRGVAKALMNMRLHIAREVDAKYAFGVTQPENESMLKILRKDFQELRTIPGAFPAGETGIVFAHYFTR